LNFLPLPHGHEEYGSALMMKNHPRAKGRIAQIQDTD
jgi:hypothetical protein